MTKILAVGGSLRTPSYTYMALHRALKHAKDLNCQVELLDLRALNLPFCNGDKEYSDFPDVKKIREAFIAADGILLCTPEYHGSVSGVLKNMLDLLTFEHFDNKVCALLAVTGGELSTNSVNDLRTICRHLHAWVIPQQLVFPFAYQCFDSQGQLVDPKLDQKLKDLIQSFVKSVQLFHPH